MKIVFLDFDGVLNGEKYVRKFDGYGFIINPQKMALLKQIIDATGAKIVLSTSWREHWSATAEECDNIGRQINELFADYGMQIFDKTVMLRKRELEIKQWLDTHINVENFVVLDDMFLSADFLSNHFVKTSNYRDGLDDLSVKKAIEILNS